MIGAWSGGQKGEMTLAKRVCRILAVLFLVTALVSAVTLAESTPPTRLEAFMISKGLIVVKDYYEVGKVQAQYDDELTVKVLVLYEPGKEAQKVKGISITLKNTEDYKSATAFVDADEVSALSRAIGSMLNMAGQWKNLTREYTEVNYITKDQCEVGFYQLGTEQKAYIYAGRSQPKGSFFEITALPEIKTVIDKAVQVLATK